MGFNLKMFFEVLEELLEDDEMKASKKLKLIKSLVDSEKKYAEVCGQLK